jgi:hypothetical protein
MSSQLTSRIITNPQYATNNIDPYTAGFYQIQPNDSNIALRVLYSNIGLTGEIRLNTTSTPPIFQGNNGSAWVDFNATQGPMGPAGLDFNDVVNFINLGSNTDVGNIVSLGEIFATASANVAAGLSNVNIRALKGGSYTVNSNLNIDTMVLTQNSNVITMTNQPIPYSWDFSAGNSSVNYLKNASGDTPFFGWGEVSKWTVKTGSSVLKGQAVRIDFQSGNLVIIPLTYTTLTGVNIFITPLNMLGIAMETAGSGDSCLVCTKGITTVLCSSQTPPFSIAAVSPSAAGCYGFVGKDGGILYSNIEPTVDYIKAGYFLESSIYTGGNYLLFYVDPQIKTL